MFHFEIYQIVNIVALVMGITFGAIAQKTQFCFSGSIKDYLLFSSTRRASSVVMAMLVVIISTQTLSHFYDIGLDESVWRSEEINYFSILLGGLLFGSGMTIADGCSSRHLVKFAQGDNKSLVTLIFIAIFAYASMEGQLNIAVYALYANETLRSLSSVLKNVALNPYFVSIVFMIILAFLVRTPKRLPLLWDGVIIGLLVTLGWYITGVYGAQTLELDTRYVPTTSMSFVGPSARTLELFTQYKENHLDFGISLIMGVLIGASIMSKFNKKYSFGCAANMKIHTLKNSMFGGALMGVGGIMTLGCTVGQGLTGLSTLALASFIAISSILLSGYVTARYLHSKEKLPMCFIFEWPKK